MDRRLTKEEVEELRKECRVTFETAMMEFIGICYDYIIRTIGPNVEKEKVQKIINGIIQENEDIDFVFYSDKFDMNYVLSVSEVIINDIPVIDTEDIFNTFDQKEYMASGYFKTSFLMNYEIDVDTKKYITESIREGRTLYYSFVNERLSEVELPERLEEIINSHKAFVTDEEITIEDINMVVNALELSEILSVFINKMLSVKSAYSNLCDDKYYVIDKYDLMSAKIWFNDSVNRIVSSLSKIDDDSGLVKFVIMETALIFDKEVISKDINDTLYDSLYKIPRKLPNDSLKRIMSTTVSKII